ncbi:low-molecular-weight cysteine-rich 69 [Prunus dulcis]|uniref:Low-molecular-weight cysteine-rich 69 n=1 Tax=Prunus dulcis TaxID=3755 RepID=A0A4Y1QS38_PRUDU|nr:low-molecular-weight cysteine-rich 69 [Prunus dulcis]
MDDQWLSREGALRRLSQRRGPARVRAKNSREFASWRATVPRVAQQRASMEANAVASAVDASAPKHVN